jgi:hypothetical protein
VNKIDGELIMKKLFLLICIFIIGCISSGQYFTIESANKVKNGMTHEEVVAIMGTNPSKILDQGKVFVWSYAEAGLSGRTVSRAVKFSFDKNGKTYGVPVGGAYGDTTKYLDK